MPYIATRDDVDLYVKDWGEGRPVILIHGWPLSSDSWDPVANALAEEGYRVLAYDRRGFGRSDQPWDGYDYDTLADDLADVMEAADITEDATLIGFSMGGGEVARYMSRHDGAGLVSAALVSSVVPYMLQTGDNPNGVSQKTFDDMTQGILADRPAFMRAFLKQFFGQGIISHPVSDEIIEWAWRLAMQAGLKPTLDCAAAFATTDFRPDLAAFDVPTLVIHGTDDKTVPIEATGRPAAAGIARSQLVEYEGAPHGLFVTHQAKLIADLKSFLSG
ncbi:MAG: alpha/beta hydrolase [Sphingobium sp.]|uniref:alpha/beta fold hydrolase n=1 Tax=Sphingobium sp. TaxID=1912891 RepID=UPI0029B012F9|nr:alpha/beta hydrolase [Sphingobium sp.]MDX3910912.1 alpha/beta hydrolase [Sphingobium sp.]